MKKTLKYCINQISEALEKNVCKKMDHPVCSFFFAYLQWCILILHQHIYVKREIRDDIIQEIREYLGNKSLLNAIEHLVSKI